MSSAWGCVLVDFEPIWFERLGSTPRLLLFATPPCVGLACSALTRSWGCRQCVAYAGIVLLWWIGGEVRNELEYAGDLSRIVNAARAD